MRRLVVLVALVVAAGCGGGDEHASDGADTSAQETSTTTETEASPPRTYDDLLALLPPLDEPASEEVEAYRRAAFETFFGRCVTSEGGADQTEWETANAKLLDELPGYPEAALTSEYSVDHRDGNGCPEGLGPPTSWTTYRTYRLPAGTVSDDVLSSFKRELAGWTEGGGTACERNYTRGEAFLAVDACGSSLRLTARALPRVEIPPPPPLPPRPYGAQYPVSEGYGKTPEPASYEVEAGETCERISSSDVPSIVIPPPPGIRAEFSDEPLHGFESQVLVEWSFDRILGDCPPVEVNLTLPNPTRGMSPLSLPFDVRARSGTARLPVLDSFRNSYVLWATAESVDGTRSRTVSVFIRRPR